MATLTENEIRDYEIGSINEHPVVADDIIYAGAAVGDSAGYARPLVAADKFKGFAKYSVDNTGGAAGDKSIRLETEGIIKLPIAGVAITNEGDSVYASDDNTFVLVETGNTKIGVIYRYDSAGYAMVKFNVGVI